MPSHIFWFKYKLCCCCQIEYVPSFSATCNEISLLYLQLIIHLQSLSNFLFENHWRILQVQWNSILLSCKKYSHSYCEALFYFLFHFLPFTFSFFLLIVRYVHVLIKRRMASLSIGPNICPRFTLEEGEVEWLGLHAYVQILKRKQSRHRELVSLLRSKLLRHRITGVVSCELKYAVEVSHSFLIWKIKY